MPQYHKLSNGLVVAPVPAGCSYTYDCDGTIYTTSLELSNTSTPVWDDSGLVLLLWLFFVVVVCVCSFQYDLVTTYLGINKKKGVGG